MAISEGAIPFICVSTPLIAVSILSVGLRLHVRLWLLRNAGVDDWLCLGALFLAILTYVANIIAVAIGFGKPFSSVTADQHRHIGQAIWVSPALWGLSSTLVKMSIMTSYMRIWTSKLFIRLSCLLLVVLGLHGLVLFLGAILACFPIEVSWQVRVNDSRCIDRLLFQLITSSVNMGLDILVFAIPIPLILRLGIARNQRFALMAVFSIGFVVCIASAMRIVVIHDLPFAPDQSTSAIHLATWSNVEANLAIICACLPALRPVFSRICPKLQQLLSTAASSSRNHHWTGWRKTRFSKSEKGHEPSHRMFQLESFDEPAIIIQDPAALVTHDTGRVGEHSWLEDQTPGAETAGGDSYMFIRYGKQQKASLVVPGPVVVQKVGQS
ncbi:hypothetical protein F4778DRAFT_49556 [Xylariomycetidae sp. FL2044]|nr:hypothetical protein F4778DRAFT_49556 [Xylariomycetidae sp. FL2044]